MISDALEAPVSDEECLKLGLLNSVLASGYTLELILEVARDLLRCLSWRVRQKYRATGATRATTTIGTTMAGIRVLRGVPLDEVDDFWAGADVCKGGDEVLVEDAMVLFNGVAKTKGGASDTIKVIVETPLVQVLIGSPFSLVCVLTIEDVIVVYKVVVGGGPIFVGSTSCIFVGNRRCSKEDCSIFAKISKVKVLPEYVA